MRFPPLAHDGSLFERMVSDWMWVSLQMAAAARASFKRKREDATTASATSIRARASVLKDLAVMVVDDGCERFVNLLRGCWLSTIISFSVTRDRSCFAAVSRSY